MNSSYFSNQLFCSRNQFDPNHITENLWTSIYNENYGSSWYQRVLRERLQEAAEWLWLLNNRMAPEGRPPECRYCTLIILKEDARILQIYSANDYENDLFDSKNYEKYKENYDAIHLTNKGLIDCRLKGHKFGGRDAESALIINTDIIIDHRKIPFNSKWNNFQEIEIYHPLIDDWLPKLNEEISKKLGNVKDISSPYDPRILGFLEQFFKENTSFKECWAQFESSFDTLYNYIFRKIQI